MKVTVQELTKSFGERDILRDFSMDLTSGERLCVCGPNGTGKSTFLRLLAGEEEPDAGRVILPRGCRLGYVEQELSQEALDSTLLAYVLASVHDWQDFWRDWEAASRAKDEKRLQELMTAHAELEAAYGYNPEQRAKEVLSGLGFDEKKWNRKLSELSGGWRERAKLARVLTAGADVLLLDEPTNHLDIDAVEWLEGFLLGFKGILVLVAHDRVFMDKIGNYILYLGLSRPILRKATYSQFLKFQEEYNERREREEKALREEYERKMAFVERFRAKATKARQAASRQKMAKKLEKQLEDYRPEPRRRELNFAWPKAPHSEKIMLAAAELGFHFPDGAAMWPPLTFTIYRDSRICLVGPNGCGKSTLLKLIAGALDRTSGNLARASQMRLGWYTQHQMDTLNGANTVLAEIRRLADPAVTEEELMSVLGLFLLGQNYFERLVADLSGGEKNRLVLASLFLKRCNFLLLDEPTNHLDLESREALARALRKFDGALLTVAHDRWLINELGLEIWEVGPRGLTEYQNFDAYEQARKKLPPQEHPEQQAPRPQLSREAQKKLKRAEAQQRNSLHRAIKPLREDYERLEHKLEEVLARQAQVEADLADPEIYAQFERSGALLKEFDDCRRESERLMDAMDSLEKRIASQKTAAGV